MIDQEALLEGLEKGTVGAAGLEVVVPEPPPPRHPLLLHPRLLYTPHLAWYSQLEARRQVAREVVRLLRGEAPEHGIC